MNKQDQTKRAALEELEKQVRFCIRAWIDNGKELSVTTIQKELNINSQLFSKEEYEEVESIIMQIKESLDRFIMFCSNRNIELPSLVSTKNL